MQASEGGESYRSLRVLEGGLGKSPPVGPPLRTGGGGGTYDGMIEARVASLETHVQYIREDVASIKGGLTAIRGDVAGVEIKIATLTERVAHLPSKGFIVTAVVTAGVLVGAMASIATNFKAFWGYFAP